jgi:hypothetical protein
MIIVLKLITGEEVIGTIACVTDEEIEALSHYILKNPMWVARGMGGDMKLYDACMLSKNDQLIFKSNCTITYYTPSDSFVNYYTQASEANKSHKKIYVNAQIDQAARDLEQMLLYEKEEADLSHDIFNSITSSKLH